MASATSASQSINSHIANIHQPGNANKTAKHSIPVEMNPQEASPYFALPQEVRDNIAAHLLAFHYSDFELTTRPGHVFLEGGDDGATPHAKPLPAAMLACRRLYRELAPHVHGTAVLRACMAEFGRRVGFAVHGTLRIERLRTLVLSVAMEHANWNTWLHFLRAVLERARGLRELIVDWEPRPVPTPEEAGAPEGKRTNFSVRQHAKMEEQFFGLLAGLEALELVRIHGNVPERWRTRLSELSKARIIMIKARWWRDDERGEIVVPVKKHASEDTFSFFSRV